MIKEWEKKLYCSATWRFVILYLGLSKSVCTDTFLCSHSRMVCVWNGTSTYSLIHTCTGNKICNSFCKCGLFICFFFKHFQKTNASYSTAIHKTCRYSLANLAATWKRTDKNGGFVSGLRGDGEHRAKRIWELTNMERLKHSLSPSESKSTLPVLSRSPNTFQSCMEKSR